MLTAEDKGPARRVFPLNRGWLYGDVAVPGSARQTSGVRYFFESEKLEDVFGLNDVDPDSISQPNHPLYLNTDFVGHMFPTKRTDGVERTQEHALRHARVHDMLGADDSFAGAVELALEGPGEIVGEHPFALVGGAGAVWLKPYARRCQRPKRAEMLLWRCGG